MKITVNAQAAYAYTGGKTFDATLPCVVLIHGALHDHSVWTLLARSLADFWGRRWNTAFNVLADRYGFRRLAPRVGSRAALVVVPHLLARCAAGDAVVNRFDNTRRNRVKTGELGVRGKFETGVVKHSVVASLSAFDSYRKVYRDLITPAKVAELLASPAAAR